MENCKITIIIPAYNVEKYLDQCLQSVINQTVTAHRAIVVDDSSTDRTGQIAKKYAENFPELITYIRQKENKGLGAARNEGLKYVTSDFVTFLDSDDWLMPNYIEVLINRLQIETEIPDIIFTLPRVYDTITSSFIDWMDKDLFYSIFNENDKVVNVEIEPRLYDLEPSACRRIFNTSFLIKNKFSFPEGTLWEDVQPHFEWLHASKRIIAEDKIGFCYRINRNGQITSSSGSGRFQFVSVFSIVFANAVKNNWTENDIFHIFSMAFNFSKWSLTSISLSLRSEMVRKIHNFYNFFPKDKLELYFRQFNIDRKSKIFIKVMRSCNYRIFSNVFTYDRTKSSILKFLNHGRS